MQYVVGQSRGHVGMNKEDDKKQKGEKQVKDLHSPTFFFLS